MTHTSRTLLRGFILVGLMTGIVFPSGAVAQDRPTPATLVGTWKGTNQTGEFETAIFFEIRRDGEGELAATMDIPARRVRDFPVSNVSLDGREVTLETAAFGVQFRGIIVRGDSTIEGTMAGDEQALSRTSPQDTAGAAVGAFAEPFTGVTAEGGAARDLFELRRTGVSTAPIVEAADELLDALTPEGRSRIRFPVDADEWRHWTNSPFLVRRGISLREMSPVQREAAFDLLTAGLSDEGMETGRAIMRVEDYVAERAGNRRLFGGDLYHLTVMGAPSADEPWGWQLDGHHLVVNYFVLGDQVVATPRFFGSEPATIDSGSYAGTEVLQREQRQGLQFMRSLGPGQAEKALIAEKKTTEILRSAPFRDNVALEHAGIRWGELDDLQRHDLLELIELYVGQIREGHARVRMNQVRQHLDEIRFAWVGGRGSEDVFYYRIHSPVILIEFDHAVPRLPGSGGTRPSRDHVHTIVRTPNGNDYGRDLLMEHYEAHEGDPAHEHQD